MSQTAQDYRQSHQDPEHARQYEAAVTESSYSSLQWEWEQGVLRDVIGRHTAGKEARGLDFACGTGRILRVQEQFYSDVTGLDISENMIAQARPKSTHARFIVADATSEPVLADEQFDVVTTFRFFLNAQESLRQEVASYLAGRVKDDGVLIFNIHLQRGSLSHILHKIWWKIRSAPEMPSLSIAHMRKLLHTRGVEVKQVRHWGVLPTTNSRLPLPRAVYRAFERVFSRIGLFRPLARNVIVICGKRAD